MRYLVTARVKPGKEAELLRAIDDGSLGAGSVAGTEYLRNIGNARIYDDGRIKWIEVCFCDSPLAEERPYWESFRPRPRAGCSQAEVLPGREWRRALGLRQVRSHGQTGKEARRRGPRLPRPASPPSP